MSAKAPSEAETYDQWLKRPEVDAVAATCRFFMQDDPVHRSLRKITSKLAELKIPYAVAGGMALSAHRFVRATVDVDILVDPQGLKTLHEKLEGLGYVPAFSGSKNLKDVETGVRIEFLVAGQFPGDGKPKPVAFPDPATVTDEIDGIKYVRLPTLIELKLASGITNAGRIKDLGDVQELIRVLRLPRDFAGQLNPFVQAKFEELWGGVSRGDQKQE